MTKKNFIITALLLFVFVINAQAQYYASALGLNGTQLKTALHNIIKNSHTPLTVYGQLWTSFQMTDTKPNSIIWDIYSDIPGGIAPYTYTYFTQQCSGTLTANSENDCYNREHTWPANYFNDFYPMYVDLFHVMPTDAFVNNKRGKLPYGKVNSNALGSPTNNGSKFGSSTSYSNWSIDNPSHQVFEPIDSFKGDVARNYFYMSTRYQGETSWLNWEMANGPELTNDAINLLLQWHHLDPVSQKEIDRNQAVYLIQGNRNPFIDYPQFADCIWGTSDCTALSVSNSSVKNSISVYPNPALELLDVRCEMLDVSINEISVYDIVGKKYIVQVSSNNLQHSTCNIQNLQQGNYILQLKTNKGVINKLFSKN